MLAFALSICGARVASAHRNGIIARGCEPCHGETAASSIDVAADRTRIAAGDTVTFMVSIRRTGVAVGGLFVADPGVGGLIALAGEGLNANAAGLTHAAPKPSANGGVTFRFGWRSPTSPGAVRLELFGLAANGDGQPTGDAPGRLVLPIVYGCDSQPFYFDADGDGFGARDFPSTLGCADRPPPVGYAETDSDCDDTHDAIHPGAVEACNGRDDDCDGQVDNGVSPVEMWPDADGDGYYGIKAGTTMLGCPPLAGFAAEPGDCAVLDATRHPGAVEVCNLLDDNCDGKIDEGVRPRCGEGLCRRESVSCRIEDCVEGIASVEVCNSLDDDCDGLVDDSTACALVGAGSGGISAVTSGPIQSSGGASPHEEGGAARQEEAGCTIAHGRPVTVQWWWCLLLLGGHRASFTRAARRRRSSTVD